MLTLAMLLYAAIVVALACYLWRHRHANFLTLATVPPRLTRALIVYAALLVVAGIVAIVALFVSGAWLKVLALVIGAGTTGVLGIRLPRYVQTP